VIDSSSPSLLPDVMTSDGGSEHETRRMKEINKTGGGGGGEEEEEGSRRSIEGSNSQITLILECVNRH